MKFIKKHKLVANSSIDSQTINTIKPYTSNSTSCNFNHFPCSA